MQSKLIDSPIGLITLIAEDGAITGLYFKSNTPDFPSHTAQKQDCEEILNKCEQELAAYFTGNLQDFTVPVSPKGTAFRESVWKELLQIRYGETASYRDIAERIGKPKAMRAVGGANHNNPISIIVPCHRIIGASGSLTGYGGGLDAKRWLLDLETKHKTRK